MLHKYLVMIQQIDLRLHEQAFLTSINKLKSVTHEIKDSLDTLDKLIQGTTYKGETSHVLEIQV